MANYKSKSTQHKTALFDYIAAKIIEDGPISLASYLSLALSDPSYGYYQKKDPFGETGDFTTAPEISGLFGEMCGLYFAHIIELSELKDPSILELGPGRGSLMADMRHAWRQVKPSLLTADLHLVENSYKLRQLQKAKLAGANLHFHDDLKSLPPYPIFAVANEFFDALPIAQAIWRENDSKTSGVWRHRLIGLSDGKLGFVDGPPLNTSQLQDWSLALPKEFGHRDGAIAEHCPLASVYAEKIAYHLVTYGGACLIIDYGYKGQSCDTLQAIANHQAVDIFYQPGNADVSHWVDFSALSQTIKEAGARLIGPVTQSEFLQEIGIIQRAETLAKLADNKTRRSLFAAVDRLISNQQMGSAFKVALLLPPGTGTPPGFFSNGGTTNL
ncbi:SAM-dependent methyltransferase [Candidatus Puniceispirillum sp.]|nr:SAM-dependent methyltransferase [Candidatus Puniceispirillum sp.]